MVDRTTEILALLVNDQWQPGVTGYELSSEWGCDVEVVREAHRRAAEIVRAETVGDDREIVRGEIARRCDRLYHVALAGKGAIAYKGELLLYDRPDIKGAVAALRLYASVAGVFTTHEQHGEVREKIRALSGLTEDQLKARVLQLADKIQCADKTKGNGRSGTH